MPRYNDISTLTFPDEFIDSAPIARQIVDEAVRSHIDLWNAIDECENHIAGEPPLDDFELEKEGLDWMSNKNWGKMRAKIESGTSQNASAVMESFDALSLEFKNSDKKGMEFLENPRLREITASIVANALMDALSFDSRFFSMLVNIERNSYTFGFCAVTRDNNEWLGTSIHPRNIAFEPESTADDCRTWVLFDSVKADVLYREYVRIHNQKGRHEKDLENPDGRTVKSHWVQEGLEEILYFAYACSLGMDKDGKNRVPESWAEVLQKFQEDSSEVIGNTPDIHIAKIFRREFDGSFSEVYIVHGNEYSVVDLGSSGKTIGGQIVPEHLLYKRNHGKRDQEDVITVIRDSGFAPNGYISELRGISKFALEDSLSFNKSKNDLTNKLTLSQPTFEQTSSQGNKKFKLGVFSGYTLAPRGFTMTEKQFSSNLQPHILMMQLDEANYNRETEHFDPSLTGKLSSRPTTQEVQTKQAEGSAAKRGRATVRLMDYGQLALRILSSLIEFKGKMSGAAKRSMDYFYERIENDLKNYPQLDGVDIKMVLRSVVKIAIQPVLEDIDKIERSLLIAESSNARNRLRRQLLKAYGFSRTQVNELLPPLDAVEREMSDQRVAALENADMESTREIVFFKSDDHEVHLDMHFSKLARILDGLRQGGDPEKAFAFSINCLSHSEKHLGGMSNSPFFKGKFKRYAQMFQNFVREVNKLRSVVEGIVKERQKEQSSQDPEMMKAKADIDMKWFEMQNKLERQKIMQDNRAQQMTEAQEFKKELAQDSADQKQQNTQELANIKKNLALATAALNLAK